MVQWRRLPRGVQIGVAAALAYGVLWGPAMFLTHLVRGTLPGDSIAMGIVLWSVASVFAGILFGVSMAIVTTLMSAWRAMAAGVDPEAPVHASQVVFMEQPPTEAIEAAKRCFEDQGWSVQFEDGPEGGRIRTRTPMTFLSFSEVVEAELSRARASVAAVTRR